MVNKINLEQPVIPVKPVPNQIRKTDTLKDKSSFKEMLHRELNSGEVKFSQHALKRLETRGIKLSQQDLMRLEGAVEKAAGKGAKDSLVLMNDLALIVSVANKTVITAIDGDNRRENVFTNIDSAVIL